QSARWLEAGMPEAGRAALRGACYLSKTLPEGYEALPGLEEVTKDPKAYCRAFLRQMQEQDAARGLPLAQANGSRFVCQNPPAPMLTRAQLDAVYALPYQRAWHPDYDAVGGVPALEEVKFSISATRGCFGSCNFCALTYHQGRSVVSRSPASIVQEAKMLTHFPDFKGYIHDVGGPTANFRRSACRKQETQGACKHRVCLYPKPCKEIQPDHREFVKILRELRALPGVKKVFIRSGLRYDYLLADPDDTFLRELCEHHVSGQLKVAPEHISAGTLACMGKPERAVFDKFRERYAVVNERLGMRQYLVPYFMSSHPGSDLNSAIELAEYLRDTGLQPEQVQDFYPTPGTLSTCMFFTGLDPRTLQPVYVPRDSHEKAMQRALLQYRRPQNHKLVREALHRAGREDLIGFGKRCLVPPARAEREERAPERAQHAAGSGTRPKKKAPAPARGTSAGPKPEQGNRIGRRPPHVALPKKKP
ncbi:MAG TPA: YgiQ family radical SAM protein, partial [Clostridia bacterium]|nr:YgiQ family radical SAM protein [Clostridia bacterium]